MTSEPVIHIGYPKCASTYLQRLVFPNVGKAANLAGGSWADKCYLFRNDFDAARFQSIVDTAYVPSSIPGREVPILSCEAFVEAPFGGFETHFMDNLQRHGLDPSHYTHRNGVISTRLKQAYPDARILIIVREPLSWAVSRYKMYYRAGQTSQPIDHFLSSSLENYAETTARYMELFGADRVRVLPFEMLERDPVLFVRRVVEFIDPAVTVSVPESRLNAAPLLQRVVEVKREKARLKAVLDGDPKSIPWGSRLSMKAWGSVGVRIGSLLQYGNQPFHVSVPAETAQRIRKECAKGIRDLADRTGLDLEEYGYVLD
jgi:hypothetical protein